MHGIMDGMCFCLICNAVYSPHNPFLLYAFQYLLLVCQPDAPCDVLELLWLQPLACLALEGVRGYAEVCPRLSNA